MTESKISGPERFFEPQHNEVFDPNKFSMVFMDSDSVTNVTSLNRVNHRRVLLFLGNGNGLVSYGKGKGIEYEEAFDNAFKDARRNMISIDIEEIFTTPKILAGRHNDFRIKIYPQRIPNYWGNPTVWELLKLTGFYHCRFTCVSRKRDPYSLIYGYFNAIVKNRTPSQFALMNGTKLHRTAYVHPTTNSSDWRTENFDF
jgi:ribosomal protein S5